MLTSVEMPENARKRGNQEQIISFFAQNLLTIREFCQAMRISERQYFRMRAEGRGPNVTWMGGKVMITKRECEAWLHRWTEPVY